LCQLKSAWKISVEEQKGSLETNRILSKINYTTLFRDQPNDKPLTQDRRYDNVLLGQAYRSHYGEVMDEHGAME
jgi:hypothetical protein